MKRLKRLLPSLLLIPVLGLAACATVDASDQGLKINRGKVKGCTATGMHWTGFFTDIKKYPRGVQHTDMLRGGEGDRKTDDAPVVASSEGAQFAIDLTINYRLSTDCETLQRLYVNGVKDTTAVKEILVRPAARSAVRDIFAKYKMAESTRSKRGQVQFEITNLLNKKLEKKPAEGAVSVDSVELRNFYLSTDLQAQVDAIIGLEAKHQQAEIQRQVDETNAQTQLLVATKGAEKTAADAEGQAAKTKKDADAQAYAITANADAQAAANAKIASSLTPALLELKIAEQNAKALQGAGKVIVTGGGSGTNTPSIVLDTREGK